MWDILLDTLCSTWHGHNEFPQRQNNRSCITLAALSAQRRSLTPMLHDTQGIAALPIGTAPCQNDKTPRLSEGFQRAFRAKLPRILVYLSHVTATTSTSSYQFSHEPQFGLLQSMFRANLKETRKRIAPATQKDFRHSFRHVRMQHLLWAQRSRTSSELRHHDTFCSISYRHRRTDLTRTVANNWKPFRRVLRRQGNKVSSPRVKRESLLRIRE